MGFDTVIDKTQLETAMTATADAIRAKTGDTDDCTWDPVTGFADLIKRIGNTGIKLPEGMRSIAVGTYTPPSNLSTPVTISHGLGEKPNFLLVFAGYGLKTDVNSYNFVLSEHFQERPFTVSGTALSAVGAITVLKKSGSGVGSYFYYNGSPLGEETFEIRANTSAYLQSGTTYYWICGVINK